MRLFKSNRSRNEAHDIPKRSKAELDAFLPECGQDCVLRQLYSSSGKALLLPEDDNLFYLRPGFSLDTLTVSQLRAILVAHNFSYASSANKAQLVDQVESDVVPRAEEILRTRDRLQRHGRGSTSTNPLTTEKATVHTAPQCCATISNF